MNTQEFTELFAEDIVMVDADDVTGTTVLDDLEDWDSMAIISLNATLDEQYGFTLNEDDIKSLHTFNDILNLIESKKTK